MFTNIERVTNQQTGVRGGVAFANNQPGHVGEGWACIPGYSGGVGRYLPVPQTSTYEQGLWIYTSKGRCQVIDYKWAINGQWDSEDQPVILLKEGEGAGGNIQATIDAKGNISMSKL